MYGSNLASTVLTGGLGDDVLNIHRSLAQHNPELAKLGVFGLDGYKIGDDEIKRQKQEETDRKAAFQNRLMTLYPAAYAAQKPLVDTTLGDVFAQQSVAQSPKTIL